MFQALKKTELSILYQPRSVHIPRDNYASELIILFKNSLFLENEGREGKTSGETKERNYS